MNEDEIEAGLPQTPGYRYADAVGDRLFVAGQVPLDGDGNLLAAGDPGGQATACLDNLATVIAVNGFELADVHHLTVHVVGPHQNLLDAWAAVVTWFASSGAHPDGSVPPATLLGAHLLGFTDQLVEIDAKVLTVR